MAFLEDKIDEIRDPDLRRTILQEVKKLKSEKKFGLVFEEHIPELAPLYNAPLRPGATAARKTGSLTDTYTITQVQNETASLIKDADGSELCLPLAELVVVKRFGEAIYPALTPIGCVETDPAGPYHTLIEADNYHALQLLEYAYAGKVDVIYLDPPYNTGARDWKYNNRYVDNNDRWRHSKWLAMMKKRLLLAIRLLRPTGIMCIAIDDYELHHLISLIEDSLSGSPVIGIVPIKNNPAGRTTTRGFAICHEYVVFVGKTDSAAISRIDRTPEQIARYNEQDDLGFFEWTNFRKHGGTDTYKITRPRQYYPIYVSGDSLRIPSMKWDNTQREWGILESPFPNETVVWPIDSSGAKRIWDFGAETAKENIEHLKVKLDRNNNVAIYRKWRLNEKGLIPLTWWDKTIYSAVEHGGTLLANIFGQKHRFPFPKSVYAVRDCLKVAGADKKNAVVLDFFAGSGTTLHATLLLNAADGGQRRCILVTNNEVSEDEARQLAARGWQPNDPEWEAQGICRSVTFPRCKYVIRGRRDDGTVLEGEYLTGRTVTRERPRTFRRIGFVHPASLTPAAKKELVSLIENIPQNAVEGDTPFFVSAQHAASILFDPAQAGAYLDALEGQEHISRFYLVAPHSKTFNDLKRAISDLLGPLQITEEEKLPMKDGFRANLEYFKLEFLDPHEVEMGRQFAAILPILWLMAGPRGRAPRQTATRLTCCPPPIPLPCCWTKPTSATSKPCWKPGPI